MEQKRRAGFWIKSCAQLIDLALVAVAIILVAEAVAGWGLYVPIEMVVIAVYLIYAGAAIGWKGQTLGQAALGIRVTRRDGGSVGWVRAFVRAGTVATCQEGLRTRRRLVFAAVTIVAGLYIAFWAFGIYRLYRMDRAWAADAEAATNRMQGEAKNTIEAVSVDAAQRTQMAAWLAEHAGDPTRTLIDLAATHQVTIVGEIHGKKPSLDFFNEAIPALYHKAGVRTLAVECCHPDQDAALARLVESREFDRGLQLALAGESGWQAWGYQGYWDVLETVWHVNQTRPPGSEPLHVVGICPRFDGPSIALILGGPWYERLRIVRPTGLVRMMLFPNGCYAHAVEREAFAEGRRTFVWVGAGHTPLFPSGRPPRRHHSMGGMLVGRYGSAVGQLVLHGDAQTDQVAALIEECAGLCAKTRIAFAPAGSPFAMLRDGKAIDYRFPPATGLGDLVSHYIMLVPNEQLRECDWMEGFLTRRMLGRNRPYYEMLAGGPIDDVNDGNRRIAEGARRL
ncbi:MAG: hypothetical protein A2Y77_18595 [Planctomycetes bacterium RBG_13_62_9]|nr:MAG: hypothetical protein A2Y77_18595 [Planctomycetes bacterium RBG_13_62_9]